DVEVNSDWWSGVGRNGKGFGKVGLFVFVGGKSGYKKKVSTASTTLNTGGRLSTAA
ncbi:hypothetical protein Tco_0583920, partial [Tanacetum coccineum]